jgi:hypothetical protein
MADATLDPKDAENKKNYDDFVKKVKSYVEFVKCYYNYKKDEEGKVKLSEEEDELLHKIMFKLSKKLLEISRGNSKYFAGMSVPHFSAIMVSTPFELKPFMGPHFSEDSDDTTKFNSKRKTSKGRKSGRKTSKGRKSARKTSKGRKSTRKTSKGRKVRN